MKNRSTLDQRIIKQKLIEAYESARGVTMQKDSYFDIQRMVYYYAQLDNLKKYYRNLLGSLNIDYNQEKCVEVGVNPVDSLLKDTRATIVTPYKGLFGNREGKTYEGSYVVANGDIEMVDVSKRKFEIETSPLEIGLGRIYLTNNILDPHSLRSWLKLSRNNQIVVGAYGHNNDLDKEKKLHYLKKFASNLDECSYNSGTQDNFYYEIVEGRPKVK